MLLRFTPEHLLDQYHKTVTHLDRSLVVVDAVAGFSSIFLLLFRLFLSPPPLRSSRGTDLIPRWDSDSAAAVPAPAAVFPSAAAGDSEDPQVGEGPFFQGILTTTLYFDGTVQWEIEFYSNFLAEFQ